MATIRKAGDLRSGDGLAAKIQTIARGLPSQ
jgi:hypothetical protein